MTAQTAVGITIYSLCITSNPLLLSHGGDIPFTGLFLAAGMLSRRISKVHVNSLKRVRPKPEFGQEPSYSPQAQTSLSPVLSFFVQCGQFQLNIK